ncbi:hypothetical protein [Granulicella mallensis]|uniref:Uncharacterized protein n=1 Tax=Granulicella mallensis (strain ATCC BAA-1857 / DSM 23137 / MP5ACTX8) TaxID=682795 RepID=G8NQ92_GRAMM|nr:hypothetical protein [Granulicella mallensis]AEU34948.1 hypothetical protein AciX8_0598 [Granulicella mallensis MP5ACTX8]
MNRHSAAYKYWRVIALTGACLIILGVGAGYVDVATHFNFEFISNHFDMFGLMGLTGVLLTAVGCIGWARHLGKRHLVLMAVIVFILPWVLLFLGRPIAGTNIHGPAAPVMLLIIPATVLAVALLMMAALKPREES